MPRGGKRPGAGRPKGSKEAKTLEKEAARAALRAQVFAELAPMIYAQIEAAKGIKYLMARQKRGGKFVPVTEDLSKAIVAGTDTEHELMEVWERRPSTQAFADLMDRAMDKAAQPMQVSGDLNLTVDVVERLSEARKRLNGVKRG